MSGAAGAPSRTARGDANTATANATGSHAEAGGGDGNTATAHSAGCTATAVGDGVRKQRVRAAWQAVAGPCWASPI